MDLTNETIHIDMYEINFNKKRIKHSKESRFSVNHFCIHMCAFNLLAVECKMNKINYIQRTLYVRGYFL